VGDTLKERILAKQISLSLGGGGNNPMSNPTKKLQIGGENRCRKECHYCEAGGKGG